MTGLAQPSDSCIGTGDGTATRFALIKTYGAGADAEVRRITRPAAGSVRVALNTTELASGWVVETGGWIRFAVPPAPGVTIRAGFIFDVPVRFENDQLEVAALALAAGEVPSVPLIEVREA